MKDRRHFRIYFKRDNGCTGAGIEEYRQSDWRPEVIAFASVYIDRHLTNSEIVSFLLDEYCNPSEPIKVKLTQLIEREAFEDLQKHYPQVIFRRTRGKEVRELRLLSQDAVSRKSTIYEKL